MILICRVGKREIDRVTVVGDTISYETEQARSVVESKIDSLGKPKAMELLRDWSNGYVIFKESKEA